jgi:histidinol-phosphate/aromatic aminotransferase/cobyric acid decarboxylase-like protein
MLQHGGGLISAAQEYGIPVNQWLDLSTGINPNTWPLPDIPQQIFNRLPQHNDGLHEIAEEYYQAESVLAIPGSQSVIQLLPSLKNTCRVAVPITGYAEHIHAWRKEGHQVDALTAEQMEENLHLYDVVVVINPNNPSAELLKPERLLDWQLRLQLKSGWLIVDEAFIDTRPEFSVAKNAHKPGLIVLRSMGKYFGLAGIRSGFVLAEESLL